VFIYWTNPLFHEAVRLLLNHPEIVWVGASSHYSVNKEQISRLSPDIVLVEEVGKPVLGEILKFLEVSQDSVRVIGLNLENNQMRTYHRVERTVGKAEDLLQWILDDKTQGECCEF
jgi:hypothetical protein